MRRLGVVFALLIAAVPGLACSSVSATTVQPHLSLELVCTQSPKCGTDTATDSYSGLYRVRDAKGFPKDGYVVITAKYPDGKAYPIDQYSYPGTKYGVTGNVEKTVDGQLPDFEWAGNNGSKPVDPPGLYHLTFTTKVKGRLAVLKNVPMRLYPLS